MNITVLPATYTQKTLVRRLSALYLHNFSKFDGADVNDWDILRQKLSRNNQPNGGPMQEFISEV